MKPKFIVMAVASYAPAIFLFLLPWLGMPAKNHSARIQEIAFSIGMAVTITFWNLALYQREKNLSNIFKAIRARGPVGYIDRATGVMHYYTDAERAAYAAEDAKRRE